MKVTEAYKGNFIEALHLNKKDVTLTISRVDNPNTIKAADKTLIDKAIVRFEESDKGFILNKTNARSIGLQLGNEMDDWTGKKITIFPTTCEAFGKVVDCIRVRPAKMFGGGNAK